MGTKQNYTYPAAAVTVPGGLDANIFDSSGNALTSTAGALDVNITGGGGANGSVSTVGNPVPTAATFLGAEDPSGDLIGLMASASGELLISSSTLATEATLAAASAKLPATLGQKAMAASMAVVIASDQSSIPVAASQSGTWNITNISGTINLPTGAATSANQTTANSSLSSIDGKLPATLGQKTMAASLPVVLASNQAAIPVTSGANPNGSYAEITNLTTSAQTLSVPANAVGFLLEASSANGANLRWKIGATATTSSGMILEPGRDTGYIPCAANISVIAESGTNQVITIQWVLSV